MTSARTKLSVTIPMLSLVQGGMGGTETYARELTRQLATSPIRLRSIVPSNAAGFSCGGVELVAGEITAGPSAVERVRSQVRAMGSRRLKALLADADVVHFPFTVPVPYPRRRPWVQTIHDVQHLDIPSFFSAPELAYRRVSYDLSARRAHAVITVSEFSRQRIIDRLGLSPERVRVVPLGVNSNEFTPWEGRRDKFVLYPARGWPHKNHRRLVDAMRIVRHTHPEFRLILTGGGLDGLGDLPPWVENRGLVPRDKLIELYRRAGCLAFPSLYEGFGLPPLEAMASGCPVAVSNAGSLPEICGGAAVMFDPESPEAIASGILKALNLRGFLFKAGLERVARFNWKTCADAHVEVYHDVAERAASSQRQASPHASLGGFDHIA